MHPKRPLIDFIIIIIIDTAQRAGATLKERRVFILNFHCSISSIHFRVTERSIFSFYLYRYDNLELWM